MKISPRILACCSSLLTLASLGCGSGSTTPPPVSAVAASAHPLVAQYSISHFDSGMSAWVEFGTDTHYGRQTSVMQSSSVTALATQKLNILVAGMKPQTTYHMRAHASWASGSWVDEDHTFTTGAVPPSITLPKFTVTQPTPGLSPAPGVEVLSLVTLTPAVAVITDLQGNVIWYYPISAIPLKLMPNGHFIAQANTDLLELDLAGNTIRDVSLSQVNQSLQSNGYSYSILNFSHDVLIQPNGHWIVICQISKDFTDLTGYPGTTSVLGDVVLDIDPTGNVVWAWSAFDYLDINRHLQGLPDWTHGNALVYTADGNLLLSLRHQSWILKIDYKDGAGTGNVLWKLGDQGDFALAGGDPTQWFYAQHYPYIISVNGPVTTMAVYDDGNLRIDSNQVACQSTATAPPCYSRGTIFQVDESTNLATLMWQDLPGFYSFWGGSIQTLSNGNVEFDSSDPSTLNSPGGALSSEILEVTQSSNPQIVWQMNTSGGWLYRGLRIPSLYPGVTWQQ
jgi:arylsulfate sulfotransferase